MKEIVMFGTGDFAGCVAYILEKKLGRSIAAYAVDAAYKKADIYEGKPLAAREELARLFPPERYDAVLGVIGKKMFHQREDAYLRLKEDGYNVLNVIDPSAHVDTQEIGEANIIFANACIEAHCRVGTGNILWQNVVCPHHNVIGDFNNLAPSVSLSGYSFVGNHCFVGNNVCINNRQGVGDHGYVGAGTYVSRTVPENAVMVPARGCLLPGKTGFDFL